MTISGEAIGRKMIRFIDERPVKSCRTRAKAIIVPRIVATSVASRPISRLLPSAWHMAGSAQGCSQLSSVKLSNR